MNIRIFFFLLLSTLFACSESTRTVVKTVNNLDELVDAIQNAQPGDDIVMANGEWKDIEIRFVANGTENKPITLRAETPGSVFIQGASDLHLAGEHLIVDGLMFYNGHSPGRSVIAFAVEDHGLANHCQVTNCVIKDYNKAQRNMTDLWVLFKGRHNQLDHCYISGKSNRGPTVRVDLEGNESINNYHKIINNHFGPRPPKGGPSAETIQIGNSYTSMAPSYTLVADNLFERCNGEVEIISSKTNFNVFQNNVFYKSEGSLVTRHGNYCTVDGNYFIGDDHSEQIGGVRLIGTGHWVTNNYFYKLKGQIFRSPLAVMNGIPKSPLNRYIQVTDVVVAHNSWIDCTSPLQFGVGSNIDESDVLPPSEIRSARPIRTLVANNLIYNSTGDPQPIVAHDQLDGITFASNLINNQGVEFDPVDGITTADFNISELEPNIMTPSGALPEVDLHVGFEFDKITNDLFGQSRGAGNCVGAICGTTNAAPGLMDVTKYGADWYTAGSTSSAPQTHKVSTASDLAETLASSNEGDIIELSDGVYEIGAPLKVDKALTIQSANDENNIVIKCTNEAETPAFEMNPKAQLTLKNIHLQGNGDQYAFASLEENMSSLYNLRLDKCIVSNFDYILKAYKYSFAEHINFTSTRFENCNNGLELSEETDDKGEYNAENIIIDSCHFENIDQNVIDYYRGGYDESTVGGNLILKNSTFTRCGAKEKNGILINTYGIINVDLSNNTFKNNSVRQVAQLWGAKNNSHTNNTISNSGQIVVEENLKLNLLY